LQKDLIKKKRKKTGSIILNRQLPGRERRGERNPFPRRDEKLFNETEFSQQRRKDSRSNGGKGRRTVEKTFLRLKKGKRGN